MLVVKGRVWRALGIEGIDDHVAKRLVFTCVGNTAGMFEWSPAVGRGTQRTTPEEDPPEGYIHVRHWDLNGAQGE